MSMSRTNIQRNRRNLWNSVTKLKFLSKMGKSFGVIMPETFLGALEITRDTLLIMSIDTIDKKIIIKKADNPEQYQIRRRSEKADYIISE